MIKLTFCLHRLAHLSREEFQSYWFEKHAPLVRQCQEALRIQRYVQAHSLPSLASEGLRSSRGAPPEYDGVAQLWWNSIEDANAVATTPAGRAAGRLLLEDERNFIDLSRSPLWWSNEHEIIVGK
jgi:uncharacterized protein (TIGR02118 family)